MITSAIETKEGRDVAIIDIPGAYIHTYVDKHGKEKMIMLFKGKLAKLMVMVDSKLDRKSVTTDSKGNTMLYVQMNKALYGLLQSMLLFYKKVKKDLKTYGFKINPFGPCVVNAMISGCQMTMTVTWHVDDLKLSHKNPIEITKCATYLASIYGEKLSVKRGKVHDYLDMYLNYSEKGSAKVSMIKYTGKVLRGFPEKVTGSTA